MIAADFYPNDSNPGNQGMTITKSVYNLNITDVTVDPMAAYYMGQIKASQDMCYKAKFEIGGGDTQSDYVYKVVPDRSVKPNWGYCYNATGANMDKITWNNGRYYGNLCFINSMEWYKANLINRNYTVLLFLYDFSGEPITLGNGEQIRQATNIEYAYLTVNPDALYEFLNHGAALNATMGGNSYALTLDKWNYDNSFFDAGNGKRIYVRIAANQSGNLGNAIYYNNILFSLNVMYSIDMPTAIAPYYGAKYYSNVLEGRARDTRIDVQNNRITAMSIYGGDSIRFTQNMDLIMETKPFELSYIAINYACTHQSGTFLNSNNDLYSATSDVQVQVNYFIDFVAWLRIGLGCSAKWCTGHKEDGTSMTINNNAPDYQANHGVPLFSSSDSPLGSIVKEDKYKDLEPHLRPWQKYGYDINDDDFDPDDPGGGAGGDPDDPTDPSKEDGVDEGDPNAPSSYSTGLSMTKFVNLNSAGWADLKTNLQQAIVDTVNNPTDTTKLGYLLGTFKSDGTWECADDLSVFKFIASARFYPFDVSTLFMGSGIYVVNQTPEAALSFGYRGASIACSNKKVNYNIAGLELVTIKVPNKKGTTNILDCTFEDFEPYTKYTLMLPFVGELAIPAHNAVCATLGIKYTIDFSSGTCCAMVVAAGGFNSASSSTCLGVLSGQCSTSVSVAGNDVVAQGDQIAAATLNKASTELSLARSKFDFGVTLGKSAVNIGEGAMNASDKGYNAGIGAAQEAIKAVPDIVHSAMDIAANNISDKMASIQLTQAQRSVPFCMNWGSNVTGNLYMETPTLRIERSLIIRPENYKHVYGYPTCKQFNLSGIKGYFQCANPDISGIGTTGTVPTETEQQMINEALRTGSFMGED